VEIGEEFVVFGLG